MLCYEHIESRDLFSDFPKRDIQLCCSDQRGQLLFSFDSFNTGARDCGEMYWWYICISGSGAIGNQPYEGKNETINSSKI